MGEVAEIVEVEAPVPAEIVHVGQVSIYQSTDARAQLDEAKARAEVLMEVINERNLAKNLGGSKDHVEVEGWQFLAGQFGIMPIVEWTREVEGGWEARALLKHIATDMVVGAGESECRDSEANWKGKPSYALRSMAQTRSISRACRNSPLVSVMVLAGFAATPAEEAQAAEVSTDDPHCPACLAINGELVGVWQNDKKPFWRCKNKAGECAGTTESNGKQYQWSGWHESYENSVAEWAEENSIDLDQPEVSPSDWLATTTQMFSEWSEEQRRETAGQVAREIGAKKPLAMDEAKQIVEGMSTIYYEQFPSSDSRPF